MDQVVIVKKFRLWWEMNILQRWSQQTWLMDLMLGIGGNREMILSFLAYTNRQLEFFPLVERTERGQSL